MNINMLGLFPAFRDLPGTWMWQGTKGFMPLKTLTKKPKKLPYLVAAATLSRPLPFDPRVVELSLSENTRGITISGNWRSIRAKIINKHVGTIAENTFYFADLIPLTSRVSGVGSDYIWTGNGSFEWYLLQGQIDRPDTTKLATAIKEWIELFV